MSRLRWFSHAAACMVKVVVCLDILALSGVSLFFSFLFLSLSALSTGVYIDCIYRPAFKSLCNENGWQDRCVSRSTGLSN